MQNKIRENWEYCIFQCGWFWFPSFSWYVERNQRWFSVCWIGFGFEIKFPISWKVRIKRLEHTIAILEKDINILSMDINNICKELKKTKTVKTKKGKNGKAKMEKGSG